MVHRATRRVSDPPPHSLKLFDGFFLDQDLQVSGNVLMKLDGDSEFAQGLQRFVELDLAAVYVEALLLESFGDIAGGYRPEELVVLSRPALETHGHAIELLGERFSASLLLGRAAHGGSFQLLDDRLVAFAGLDGELLGQKKIASVAL